MPAARNNGGNHENIHDRNVSDPTFLTTQQLLRELNNLKEVVFTRLDGLDRATEVFNEHITRVPTDTDKQISQLKELIEKTLNERFAGVENQFTERDERSVLIHDKFSAAKDSIKEVLETRLNSMDKAVKLLKDQTDTLPHSITHAIKSLQDLHGETFKLHNEKFMAVQRQFEERDTRTDKTAELNQKAIDAALQAAKEAVGAQDRSNSLAISKSEAATNKQIESIANSITTNTQGNVDKIDDIKERTSILENRITAMEGRGKGTNDSWAYVLAIIDVLGGVIGGIAMVVSLFHKA